MVKGRIVRLGACGVSGALMACATPPMNVYPMAWLGLVAFYWLLDDGPRYRRGALRGALRALVFGIGTNLVALRFISTVVVHFAALPAAMGPVALLILATFEATRLVTAAVVHRGLARLGVPRVLAFGVGIYAGTFLPTAIPWTNACGICPWLATVQIADLVGERGVAFLMAIEAGLVAEGLGRLARGVVGGAGRRLAAAGALVAGTLVYGAVRIGQVDEVRASAPTASIALVEQGLPASESWELEHAKATLRILTDLTKHAEAEGAKLVIWPETSYPFTVAHVSRHGPRGANAIVQPGVHGPVLTGLIMTGDRGRYNSAVVATADGLLSDPYDKMHMMWFGEMIPLEDEIPWLREAFSRGVGLVAGERPVRLDAGPVHIAVLNCLEDILPSAGREAMATSPNLLVNITNDGWFEGTAESEYHLLLSRLRSIELRRDLVRAVNYGPTTWVDAAGRIVARHPTYEAGWLMTRPALLEGMTPYARWGDLPLSAGLGLWMLVHWKRRRPGGASSDRR